MTPGERLAELMRSGALVCQTEDVAAVLGSSVWAVHQHTRAGTLPLEPIRVGRKYKWRVADLASLVGVDMPAPVGGGAA